jgi:hypothetical protein
MKLRALATSASLLPASLDEPLNTHLALLLLLRQP